MLTVASAQADLILAKKVFYDDGKIWLVNPEIHNQVAYHSAQAIEKLLKLFVKEKSEELFETISYTHNISEVLIKLEFCRKGFVENHKDIALNADIISRMNRLRYGDGVISRDDCYVVLNIAKALCSEYLQEYVHGNDQQIQEEPEERPFQFHMRDVGRMMSDMDAFGR